MYITLGGGVGWVFTHGERIGFIRRDSAYFALQCPWFAFLTKGELLAIASVTLIA